jgi:hypothetical protein
MKNRISIIIIFIIGFILSYISFNHIDAWLGVILFIVTIVFILNLIYKQLKN